MTRPRDAIGRWAGRLSVATVVAIVTVGLAVVTSQGAGKSKGKHDPDDAVGPLDIARVHLGQDGPDLSLKLETFGPWQVKDLIGDPEVDPATPQSYVCIELVQHSHHSRNCLTSSKGGRDRLTHLRVDAGGAGHGGEPVDAGVKRAGKRSARISFRFGDVDLKPGKIGWRLISGSNDPACVPAATAAAETAADEPKPDTKTPDDAAPPPPPPPPPPTPTGACTDQLPDGGGTVRFKIRRPRIVGCTHGGPLIRSHAGGHGKQVALTFDDGPSSYTANVLKILDDRDVKGTFFVIGQEIGGRAEVMKKVIESGHEIGNHSMHHETLPSSSSIRGTSSLVKRATGFRPCSFRPPGGAINLSVARSARSAGMTSILWDIDTRDWDGPPSSATIRSRATNAHPGSIVLMHDGGGNRSGTVAALPGIISTLKGRGYELVTVSRLLGEHPIWKP